MKTVTYDETQWKLVPLEPVAEILAGASESVWSVVTPKDMEIAEQAALILLRKSQGSGPFPSVRDIAQAVALMAPAYRAVIAAAPEPPAQPLLIDIDAMVNRFLAWRLPDYFRPDAGIAFTPLTNPDIWPAGTNLFTSDQAKQMILHMLDAQPAVSDEQPKGGA